MKKFILISIGVLTLNLLTNNAMAQSSNSHYNSDTLCIVWTSGDPDVALKMVFMYANTAKKNRWFNEVELIVWGPSAKLASENKEIQETLVKMVENGVKIEACKACADQYGVSQNLKSLGIEVKYMGKPLTEILKSNKKLMTF
jgi:hypothetical protein